MSFNFANNYFFTLNRNYFSSFGYKLITYEGLNNVSGYYLDDLTSFSKNLYILNQSNLLSNDDRFEISVFLNFLANKYYLPYFVYYTKSFYEFEPLDFSCITNYSVYYSTLLAYTTQSNFKKIEIYNLNRALDFFNYVRNSSFLTFVSTVPKFPKDSTFDKFLADFYTKIFNTKNKYILSYNRLGIKNFFFNEKTLTTLLTSKFNPNTYVTINTTWLKSLKNVLHIRFSDSSISKYIALDSIQKYKLYYIRKNRIFNKGRYSRNRQLYRTGVYWCLWLNIMVVYGLYFFFYRFMFNFGYLWVGMAFLAFSFIFARVCQNRLYNFTNLINEFIQFWQWFCILFSNIYSWLYLNYLSIVLTYISTIYSALIFTKVLPVVYTSYIYRFLLFFSEETRKIKSARFVFYWEYFVGEDKSFLKIKSKIHWFKQVWKMLTN